MPVLLYVVTVSTFFSWSASPRSLPNSSSLESQKANGLLLTRGPLCLDMMLSRLALAKQGSHRGS